VLYFFIYYVVKHFVFTKLESVKFAEVQNFPCQVCPKLNAVRIIVADTDSDIYRCVQLVVVKSAFLLECHGCRYSGYFYSSIITRYFKPGNNLTAVCWQLSSVVPAVLSLDERTAPCLFAGQAGVRVCLQPVLYATLLLCEVRGKGRSGKQ
jgi:hypothetical protein